ncbi:MAG: type II toxin-antitoxin system PemK/MazF family toxin [Magnetospirillum sp. WYHS-4]
MTFSTVFDRWAVVVAPFPFVDAPKAKPRPCLVLSRAEANRATGHSVCAMVTRPLVTCWPNDTELAGWERAGLVAPCRVRWKLFTLPNEVLRRKLGDLSPGDREACRHALTDLLGEE